MNNKLEHVQVKRLTESEREQVWHLIADRLGQVTPVQPRRLLLRPQVMLQIFIALLLVIGGGTATVQAADRAKPGDVLFPLDQAIEQVQLKISSKAKQDELKVRFSQERVDEVDGIIAELNTTAATGGATTTASSTTAVSSTVMTESTGSNDRLQTALGVAVDYLENVKVSLETKGNVTAASRIDDLLTNLAGQLDRLPSDAKTDIHFERQADGLKFEVKTKTEDKREIRLQLRSQSPSRDDDRSDGERDVNDDEGRQSGGTSNSTTTLLAVQAKVYGSNYAFVKVKYDNGREDSFSVAAGGRSAISAAIADRLKKPAAQIESLLKMEYEVGGSGGSYSGSPDNSSSSSSASTSSTVAATSTTIIDLPSLIEKIEAEADNTRTKVKVHMRERDDDEFNLNTTVYNDVVTDLSAKYDLPEITIRSLLKFEISH